MQPTFEQLKSKMAERLRTNAEIDYLNQFIKEGEPKIPYELNADNTPIIPELTDEQKAEAEEKQKALDKEAEAEKQRIIAEDKEKNKSEGQEGKEKPNDVPTEIEYDEKKILAFLKTKGKEFTSIDEFINPKKELTEEEKQAEKEQRESNKVAYGLQNGKFTKKELESFINDTKNPTQLVYAAYYADQKAKDDTLKDEDIQIEFDEKFGLDLEDKESRQAKAGQLLLNNIANNLIREKHSKILNLENDYSAYENTTSNQNAQLAKIQAQTPLYKKDVELIRNEVKKVSLQMSKDETFDVDLPEGSVNGIIEKMLANDYSEKQVQKGWTKEEIKQVAQTTAIIENLPTIMQKYADAQILKKQAGVRGIIPENERRGKQLTEDQLTENQKKAQEHYKQVLNVPVGAN